MSYYCTFQPLAIPGNTYRIYASTLSVLSYPFLLVRNLEPTVALTSTSQRPLSLFFPFPSACWNRRPSATPRRIHLQLWAFQHSSLPPFCLLPVGWRQVLQMYVVQWQTFKSFQAATFCIIVPDCKSVLV